MDDHLTDDPPTSEKKQAWVRNYARLLLQIRNSVDSEVIYLINPVSLLKS